MTAPARPLEEALTAWFRDGSQSPAVAALYALAPESFELLGYFSRHSSLRASIAAREVCRALFETQTSQPQSSPQPRTSAGAGGDERAPGPSDHGPDDAAPPSEAPWSGEALHDGIRRAEAQLMDADALEEALASLSPWEHLGHHLRGSALSELALMHVGPLVDLLDKAPELKRLAELLGRIEAQTGRGPPLGRSGRQWVEGVTFGADPADLLASELALLADPATEPLFDVRFLEKKLFQLQWSGGEPFGPARPLRQTPRGPVIVAVDTSASMTGAPLLLARAAALALVRRALAEGRLAHVLLFGGRHSVLGFTFSPKRAAWDELSAFLSASFGGGTDLAGPIRAALSLRESDPRFAAADIALVSDGIAVLPEKVTRALAAAKKSGLRLGAMAILRPGRGAGILELLADPLEKLETAAFSV